MIVIGVDASSSYTGLARVTSHAGPLYNARPRLAAVSMGNEPRGVLEAHARADKPGAQAEIGFAVGWIAGLVVGPCFGLGALVHRVDVSPWRTTMLLLCAREGLRLEKPRRGQPSATRARPPTFKVERGPGGTFEVHYAGCDHVWTAEVYLDLHTKRPEWCPTCAAEASKPARWTDADAIRDDWKRTACEAFAHFWPETYAPIVAAARARAKTHPPDHRLAGVADACEAAWIALHGLHTLTETP